MLGTIYLLILKKSAMKRCIHILNTKNCNNSTQESIDNFLRLSIFTTKLSLNFRMRFKSWKYKTIIIGKLSTTYMPRPMEFPNQIRKGWVMLRIVMSSCTKNIRNCTKIMWLWGANRSLSSTTNQHLAKVKLEILYRRKELMKCLNHDLFPNLSPLNLSLWTE